MNTSRKKHSARSRNHVSTSLRAQRSNPWRSKEVRKSGLLRFARNDDRWLRRCRATHYSPPLPPRALARGGEGSGVGGASTNSAQNESANLPRHPPPPTPKSELRSSRPHRFAGGGEQIARRRCGSIVPSLHGPLADTSTSIETNLRARQLISCAAAPASALLHNQSWSRATVTPFPSLDRPS